MKLAAVADGTVRPAGSDSVQVRYARRVGRRPDESQSAKRLDCTATLASGTASSAMNISATC